MKAYQMTLAQYQVEVTPLLQALVKFAKKNKQYYIAGDYRGMILVDFYKATKINFSAAWLNLDQATQEEWMVKRWKDNSGFEPIKVVPDAVKEEYEAIITALSKVMPVHKIELDEKKHITLQADEVKSNKRIVKDAVDFGTYATLIESGEMTIEDVQTVLDSVKVRMPKSLEEKVKEFKRIASFKRNPVMMQFMEMIISSFKAERDNYFNLFSAAYTKQIERYVTLHNEAVRSTEREEVKNVLSDVLLSNWYRFFKYAKNGNSIEKAVDFDKQFVDLINYILDKQQEEMVGALCGKVEMVLSKLVAVEKIKMVMGNMGLEGSFKFMLENGSFIIDTQAIYAVGEINRAHFRYLAHYKQVEKDDISYGTQNFEQMVKLFGKMY